MHEFSPTEPPLEAAETLPAFEQAIEGHIDHAVADVKEMVDELVEGRTPETPFDAQSERVVDEIAFAAYDVREFVATEAAAETIADHPVAHAPATETPGSDPSQTPGQTPAEEPTQPSSSNTAEDVIGHPAIDERYWSEQIANGYCGAAAVADIINQFSGGHYTDVQVMEYAQEEHLAGAAGLGISGDNLCKLLDDLGIQSEVGPGNVDDLKELVAQGHDVILAVDANKIWFGQTETDSTDKNEPDHAVLLTGFAEEHGQEYAILNDSGVPHGAGEMVPLQWLINAWSDSGNQMIVTDGVPAINETDSTGSAASAGATTQDAPVGAMESRVLIPFGH